MSVGWRRSALPPWATMRWPTVATIAAITTEIELSGPATAKGSELRSATTVPPTAADRKVPAIP
jgi:hypothetical protein